MCHTSVLNWVPTALPAAEVAGRRVLEVGSYDVNGSVRPLIEAHGPASYTGVDQVPGPRVDQVVPTSALVDTFGAGSFDIVISTEMLEHAEDWRASLLAMAQVLRPGGLLVITTRSPGFPYHPFPDDHWRFTVEAMRAALTAVGCGSWQVHPDPQAPGVFARARKSDPWRADPVALGRVAVEAVSAP